MIEVASIWHDWKPSIKGIRLAMQDCGIKLSSGADIRSFHNGHRFDESKPFGSGDIISIESLWLASQRPYYKVDANLGIDINDPILDQVPVSSIQYPDDNGVLLIRFKEGSEILSLEDGSPIKSILTYIVPRKRGCKAWAMPRPKKT